MGTGVAHSVADFVDVAFKSVGLDYQEFVKVDPAFLRPAEVDHLKADPGKARRALGWKPNVSFEELVEMMVDHDVYRLKNGLSAYAAVAAHE